MFLLMKSTSILEGDMTISSLKNKVWKVFSEYIRRKYADYRGYVRCITCGRMAHWKTMDAGHFVSRQYNATLFDEENVHPQCKRCNNQGGEPESYALYLQRRYGMGMLETLRRRKLKTKQFTVQELQKLLKVYQEKLEKL